ncbi:hypothetical protein V8E53_002629 [Lactarius tabidus]|jgi:ribosomal protein L6P/L9E
MQSRYDRGLHRTSVPRWVGYRAALEADPRGKLEGMSGMRLNMKLGFSHPVIVPVPGHVKVEVPYPTKIILSCTDKHQVGLFAAKVFMSKQVAIPSQPRCHEAS